MQLLSSLGRHDEAKESLSTHRVASREACLRVSYASILYVGQLKRAIETYRMAWTSPTRSPKR